MELGQLGYVHCYTWVVVGPDALEDIAFSRKELHICQILQSRIQLQKKHGPLTSAMFHALFCMDKCAPYRHAALTRARTIELQTHTHTHTLTHTPTPNEPMPKPILIKMREVAKGHQHHHPYKGLGTPERPLGSKFVRSVLCVYAL